MLFDVAVANTKFDWFCYLRDHYEGGLINLSFPCTYKKVDLKPKDIIAFYFKSPINRVGGLAYLEEYSPRTVSEAWDMFGTMNGYPDKDSFYKRFALHAQKASTTVDELTTGCFALKDCRFFSDSHFRSTEPYYFTFSQRMECYKKLNLRNSDVNSFFYDLIFNELDTQEYHRIFDEMVETGYIRVLGIIEREL